ncbi:universal stress protein [Natronolimnohabitans sp. A-GB9]|uniref:universal stress protein n=1 Tax=Natronolimnohabitans sp. A-GB9 TaxID=3069757 RepID=UPI0027B347B0|nr:universal stress protein [Natronolimnohabitans sp. A-GB9]MDQ2051621.1 universal stress protein [Natronolimnohabitans sp. A-GB9]
MSIQSFLLPTDGSEPADAAAKRGVELAAQLEATVHVLSVVDSSLIASADQTDEPNRIRNRLREYATEQAETVGRTASEGDLEVTTATREGVPAEEIVDYADERDVDAIVMGTSGRGGVSRAVLGSVTDKVVRTATVPVVTVTTAAARDEQSTTVDDLLVPTDGSVPAESAAQPAIEVAAQLEATVHFLTVADTELTSAAPTVTGIELLGTAGDRLEDLAETATERGLEVTTTVREGDPATEIVDYAETEGIDLIAMGTAGRGGLDRLILGSVTDEVVRTAPVPVVTVRPD